MNISIPSPRSLWFCAWILAALSSVRAAPVAPDLACRVAAAWSAENAALTPEFGEALEAVPVTDADGRLLWYEVPTAGGGCLVVAPDTDLEPVIAAIPDYEGGIPEGHPLRALLEADMRQRLSVLDAPPDLRAADRTAASAASAATSAEFNDARAMAEAKWARLANDAGLAPSDERNGRDSPLVFASSTAGATPARVYSFIDEWKRPKLTHWNQNGWNSFGSWDNVYDLYTPNHYPCGCVATAGAALLQFFGVTKAPTFSNTCYVDGAKRTLTTKGGTYDWSKLPTSWYRGQTLTDEQKDILGRATYDMGVCLGMSYKSGGSGASISTLATVLREKYGFADARYVYSIGASHYEKLIYAQVRCGVPVVLSISGAGGHAVLAVGYGEDADAAAYTRVFMGWGGSGDAWYALPNVEDFTTLDGVVTMIGTTTATVPVCGRVVDANGTGDGFASVSRYTSSSSYTTVMANEFGAWGSRVSPTLASAARKVACKGVSRTYSIGSSAATVQSYSSSTLCAALPDVMTLVVPSAQILPVHATISAAREKAVAEGKLVFVLAGAQWCGYCAQLKRYLNSLGTDFSDQFVLCYLDMDEEQPSAMRVDGFPTYGVFDPRRLGEAGWTAANGLMVKDSGWEQSRVDALLEEGWAAWTAVDRTPTGLVLTLPPAIVSPTACSADVAFADGETCPLSDGVSWSVTSGTAATIADGVLTPVSGMNGTVTVRATATIAGKTLSKTATVRIVNPSEVSKLAVSGPDVIDLYDAPGAQFAAVATLSDGSTASIGVTWTVAESAVTNAVVSSNGYVDFPTPSKYTKASRLTVTASFGAHTATATAAVWGWSVSLSSWTTPQRVVWPGQTIRIVPQSVTWWRHGMTEEPTTDLSNVDFGIEHGWVNGKTLLSAANAASGENGLTQKIPTDVSEPEGDCSFYVTTAATRFGHTITKGKWPEFKYLPSAPLQTVDVTFVADGGEPATQTTKYAVGHTYGHFPDAARKGYYGTWYTAAEGGTRMTTASNCVASVTRLYARWSPRYYYIDYDPNGGTGTMYGQYFYYDDPANLTANAFTKVGHTFGGWSMEPGGVAVFKDKAAILNLASVYTNITLYAAWTPATYTVTLNAQNGTGGSASATATYGAAMPAITMPARTGYAFGGYYTAANGGGTLYYTAAGTSARTWDKAAATTLYAKWTARTYAVTLDPQGGEGGSATVTATFGSALPDIAVPRLEGLFFDGYWTEPDGEGVPYYTGSGTSARNWDLASGTTLYAHWIESVPLAVHRFYSKAYKGHFFTISEEEKQNLIDTNPNWRYEGASYRAFTNQVAGTAALYRFYSKGYRGHFFTVDAEEAETVKKNPNWKYEGIAYYVYPERVSGSVPVFRFWSKGYRHHFYTTNEEEKDNLIATNPNWKFEGEAFYALPAAENAEGTALAAPPADANAAAAPAGARVGGVPSAPTGVSASDGTYTDRIRVSWSASAGAASYAVYRSGSVSGEKAVVATTLGTSIDDTSASVLPGMTYYYWVKARNEAGESGFSSYDTGWKQIHNIAPYSVFRFYSKNYKGHFFTIDEAEKDDLIATNPNWKYEGVAYRAFKEQASGTVALHRFYSKNYRGHFFTVDPEEAETVKTNPNWKYEGIAYYVLESPDEIFGSVPVYRFWSKGYRHHFYTTNEAEKDDLIAHNPNWKYEGIAFYALPALDANAAAPAPGGKGAQRALRDVHAAAWTLAAADGAAIAVPGVTEADGALVEVRLDAPDADELAGDDPASAGAETLELRLSLPGGAFDASLWSAAEGVVVDKPAEDSFDFALPGSGVWHWLRVRDGGGEEAFSVWLRAE